MSYGAFVKLEEGIEGLVHISEMSWTKRINHPSELVNIGDKIEVVVLGINQDKQEISLGMKQTQANPWDQVAGKYPPGTMVEGTVRNLTNYGAFIEIEEGIDGLLHISDMSWTRKIGHPNEMLEKGQTDQLPGPQRRPGTQADRAGPQAAQATTRGRPTSPAATSPSDVVKGKVTKLTNFGVFVELEPGLEGLLHISELADHKVDSPEEVVKVGDEIEVKILRVDRGERKIGLSRKKAQWTKPRANARKAPPAGRRRGRRRPPRRPRSSRADSAAAARSSAWAAHARCRNEPPRTESASDLNLSLPDAAPASLEARVAHAMPPLRDLSSRGGVLFCQISRWRSPHRPDRTPGHWPRSLDCHTFRLPTLHPRRLPDNRSNRHDRQSCSHFLEPSNFPNR